MRPPLYELLPAYLRNRDWYEGEPLRALVELLEWQYHGLEEDVAQLWDDWFVETCQDRLVPLLGDLIGVRGLDDPQSWFPGQRTRVANSLVYRQAKGTTGTLARVARDVTGWPAIARPGFRSLVFAQSLDHLRPERGRVIDLRAAEQLELLGGPFDRLAHVVRLTGGRSSCGAGAGARELALHFWRLRSYPVRGWTARRLQGSRFSMHPLGFDLPLFVRRSSPEQPDRELEPHNLPRPLDRRTLDRALDAHRRGERRGAEILRLAPFEIIDPASGEPIPWSGIMTADLSDGAPPPEPPAAGRSASEPAAIRLAVDPERGRFAFLGGSHSAAEVRVSCVYGFGGDLGGGPYERQAAAARIVGVRRAAIGGAGPTHSSVPRFASLLEAVDERPRDPTPPIQVLEIADSATYGGVAGLRLTVAVEEGTWLLVEAAPGQFPAYVGDLEFVAAGDSPDTRVTLSGLLIGGTVSLRGSARLEIDHCTVMSPPELGAARAAVRCTGHDAARATSLRITRSIVGPLRLDAGIAGIEIEDSIVDGRGGAALAADDGGGAGPRATIRRTTVLGAVTVVELHEAADSLLDGRLSARRGSLRHCYCPPESEGPPRQSCVPDEALAAAHTDARRAEKLTRLRPAFAARDYGQPGYAQLGPHTPAEIRTGAASGSEIGAFESLRNPQRERNLEAVLREYLPWGQEGRIRYES